MVRVERVATQDPVIDHNRCKSVEIGMSRSLVERILGPPLRDPFLADSALNGMEWELPLET